MARLAGMKLRERWADWDRSPFTAESSEARLGLGEGRVRIELPIESERLVIRPLVLEDADDLREDPAWIQSKIDRYERDGGMSLWAAVDKESGKAVALAGLPVGGDRRQARARPRLRRRRARAAEGLRDGGVARDPRRRVRRRRRARHRADEARQRGRAARPREARLHAARLREARRDAVRVLLVSVSGVTARARRSCLSVPASSERMLAKAPSLGADEAIVDLEDAVAPEDKVAARELAVAAVRRGPLARTTAIRVNAARLRVVGGRPARRGGSASRRCRTPEGRVRPGRVPLRPSCCRRGSASRRRSRRRAGSRTPTTSRRPATVSRRSSSARRISRRRSGFPSSRSETVRTTTDSRASSRPRARAASRRSTARTPGSATTSASSSPRAARSSTATTASGSIHPSQIGPVHLVFTPSPAEIERAKRILAAPQGRFGSKESSPTRLHAASPRPSSGAPRSSPSGFPPFDFRHREHAAVPEV